MRRGGAGADHKKRRGGAGADQKSAGAAPGRVRGGAEARLVIAWSSLGHCLDLWSEIDFWFKKFWRRIFSFDGKFSFLTEKFKFWRKIQISSLKQLLIFIT